MSQTVPPPETRIEIYSDVVCPWCWIAKRHLERALPVLAARGLAFAPHWHPFQLHPELPTEGVERAAWRARRFGSPAEAAAADARVAEAGHAVGLTFRHDLLRRIPNTLDAHRVLRLAEAQGMQAAVLESFYAGYFTEGADLGVPAILTALAVRGGLAEAAVASLLAGEEGRAEVAGEDAAVRRAGLEGVPAFAMGPYLLFSGAVPADTMVEAFAKAWQAISRQGA